MNSYSEGYEAGMGMAKLMGQGISLSSLQGTTYKAPVTVKHYCTCNRCPCCGKPIGAQPSQKQCGHTSYMADCVWCSLSQQLSLSKNSDMISEVIRAG